MTISAAFLKIGLTIIKFELALSIILNMATSAPVLN